MLTLTYLTFWDIYNLTFWEKLKFFNPGVCISSVSIWSSALLCSAHTLTPTWSPLRLIVIASLIGACIDLKFVFCALRAVWLITCTIIVSCSCSLLSVCIQLIKCQHPHYHWGSKLGALFTIHIGRRWHVGGARKKPVPPVDFGMQSIQYYYMMC